MGDFNTNRDRRVKRTVYRQLWKWFEKYKTTDHQFWAVYLVKNNKHAVQKN